MIDESGNKEVAHPADVIYHLHNARVMALDGYTQSHLRTRRHITEASL